jgi:hypothetical protein
MATIEESVKTEVITRIHRFGSPRDIREWVQNKTDDQIETLLEWRFQWVIKEVLNDHLSAVVISEEDEEVCAYDMTETTRAEFRSEWDKTFSDPPPNNNDYPLVDHFEDNMYQKYKAEWFDYFKTYRDSE